ncbi:MAG TPA: D-cysteine desulfhydrase family protein [Gemmatimonadaceae bacterium]|jgi:D-cysteine desulfhydrase family pyridoxal phosphate-dependent enzyme
MSLETQPRVALATLPTPLLEATRLRAALGGVGRCPRILIKRDDLTGLALGGNKARKLEFLMADALRVGADVIVSSGATQSNHARMTAGAARMVGLECVLVLSSRHANPPLQGNLLLDRLFGATVHFIQANVDPRFAVAADEVQKVAEVVDELTRSGRKPYVIPVGGSSPIGAMGYVDGTRELHEQLRAASIRADRLYFGSGSRGTQAGLELGARAFKVDYKLHGIAVSAGEEEKVQRATRLANEAAALLGLSERVDPAELFTDQRFIGEGYGVPTEECLEAIRLLARSEAILLDPCYTGKGMAGMLHDIRQGAIDPDETITFLHTGGSPALFAQPDPNVLVGD